MDPPASLSSSPEAGQAPADLPWESDDEIDYGEIGNVPRGELGVDCWMNPLSSSLLTHPLDPGSMLATARAFSYAAET